RVAGLRVRAVAAADVEGGEQDVVLLAEVVRLLDLQVFTQAARAVAGLLEVGDHPREVAVGVPHQVAARADGVGQVEQLGTLAGQLVDGRVHRREVGRRTPLAQRVHVALAAGAGGGDGT